eukprot:12891511-Prorocentrum_lima.AAC.1
MGLWRFRNPPFMSLWFVVTSTLVLFSTTLPLFAARSSSGPRLLVRQLFRARARLRGTCLTYAARIALVHTLIVSRLLYGAESWPLLPEDHLSLLYQPL